MTKKSIRVGRDTLREGLDRRETRAPSRQQTRIPPTIDPAAQLERVRQAATQRTSHHRQTPKG
jgi:hypothetical protein